MDPLNDGHWKSAVLVAAFFVGIGLGGFVLKDHVGLQAGGLIGLIVVTPFAWWIFKKIGN